MLFLGVLELLVKCHDICLKVNFVNNENIYMVRKMLLVVFNIVSLRNNFPHHETSKIYAQNTLMKMFFFGYVNDQLVLLNCLLPTFKRISQQQPFPGLLRYCHAMNILEQLIIRTIISKATNRVYEVDLLTHKNKQEILPSCSIILWYLDSALF